MFQNIPPLPTAGLFKKPCFLGLLFRKGARRTHKTTTSKPENLVSIASPRKYLSRWPVEGLHSREKNQPTKTRLFRPSCSSCGPYPTPPFYFPPPPQIWFRPLIRPYSESPTFNRASHVNGNQVTRNNPFVTTPEIWHVPWKGTLFKKDMHYNPTINFQLGDVSLVQGNVCLSSHCFGTPSFIQFCHPTRGHHLLGVTGFRHTRYQLQFEVATETSEWSSLSYQHFKGDSRGTPNKGTPIW